MKHFSLIFAEILIVSLFFIPKQENVVLESSPQPSSSSQSENSEQIRVVLGEKVVEMELDEYVLGVVCAEMPMSWPEEAIKAQAVAARSYALYQKSAKKHENGDVCGDSTCCQGYKSPEEMAAFWGEERGFYTQKAKDCVGATRGLRVFYEGLPAATVYHASSAGQTNAAEAVWGQNVPYLVAVDTESAAESKGHGVGMSQWGAKAMAEEGKSFLEILAHYYPGTRVTEG